MPNESTGKMGLQILITILVAALLGATGWVANASLQAREENVRLKERCDNLRDRMTMEEERLNRIAETQQTILQKLIELKDTDLNQQNEIHSIQEQIKYLERR